ncbi:MULTISPECIES: CorA family divalent cation transporter [unclassified Thalassospira]|uniref:CorA family divalent cation transporter n=1 Tax=unclassified Thalassospira TaxID=2648997 RepID=UPI000A1EED18|nr:CorA family divalent cation transporter [Thalassospira sp. MCCC 1A01428]OSQ44998.1 magnesium transporter [Thalassospira sp. MCCC 1A01428]
MTPKALINAFRINNKGKGVALSGDEFTTSFPEVDDGEFIWVHLDWMEPGVASWLTEQAGLEASIVETLATRGTRPSVLFYDHGYSMNLRGVNLNRESDPADMISVRIWCSDKLVITLRNQHMRAFDDIRASIAENAAPGSSDAFVLTLAERLVFRIDAEIRNLEENLDDLEDQIEDVPETRTLPLRMKTADMRHRLSRLRRHISPQRDAMAKFVEQKPAWSDKIHKRRARTLTDRVTRLVEELDSLRERTQIANDSLMAVETERMNRTMYWLTVIAGLFLPISFVTGLLGVNVGGIPAANNSWGFWGVSILLAALVGLEVWLFKKMRLI